MPTLVTLATYEQSKTACFLKEKFERANIDCFFAIVSTAEGDWDEVRIQVKEEDVERAVLWCRQGPSYSSVTGVEVKEEPFTGGFDSFSITY